MLLHYFLRELVFVLQDGYVLHEGGQYLVLGFPRQLLLIHVGYIQITVGVNLLGYCCCENGVCTG